VKLAQVATLPRRSTVEDLTRRSRSGTHPMAQVLDMAFVIVDVDLIVDPER
jgi:hypothetical protein